MFEDILNNIEKDKKIELSRIQKTFLYVINTLNELVDKGIMEGKAFELSDNAYQYIEDFEPTDEEIQICMSYMKSEGYIA
jgi:hypothetical protein